MQTSDQDKEQIARKIAMCIKYLHNHGVEHQDLKPSNIIIVSVKHHQHATCVTKFVFAFQVQEPAEAELKVFIVEVGIANLRMISGSTSRTTDFYRAPEINEDNASETMNVPSADIYSLGCVLVELFGGVERPSSLRQWPNGSGSAESPQLLQTYWDICERCHQAAAAERPVIKEVVDALYPLAARRKNLRKQRTLYRMFSLESHTDFQV